MIRYSIIIACRDTVQSTAAILAELLDELDKLILPYEIILVDDGSIPAQAAALADLARDQPCARVLRFAESRGTSAALTAGVAASRGELVIALSGAEQMSMRYIPHLIARLGHCEFVFAKAERSLVDQLGRALSDFALAALGSRMVRDGDELAWASRREAVAGIALAAGAFRALPAIVARRGFRVVRLTLSEHRPPQGTVWRLNIVRRALAAWLDRRFEPHLASERPAAPAPQGDLELLQTGAAIRRRPLAPAPVPAQHGPNEVL